MTGANLSAAQGNITSVKGRLVEKGFKAPGRPKILTLAAKLNGA